MCITEKISAFVKDRAINLSAMSRATGIPYGVLYDSLANKNRERPLNVDEAIIICKFLGMKVEDFADAEEPAEAE